jgi:uncharacterized protein (TIGR00369 family)
MPSPLPPGSGLPDPDVMQSLTGLEFMRRIATGELPSPPIAITMGFRIAEVEAGCVVVRAVTGPHACNPLRVLHGGYAATLLDTCMACAVHTLLPAGVAYTSLELKVSFIRGLTHESGEVIATGRALHAGRRAGFAEGEIRDAGGRLVAHGTTTCIILAP